jgi:hypothetical protein
MAALILWGGAAISSAHAQEIETDSPQVRVGVAQPSSGGDTGEATGTYEIQSLPLRIGVAPAQSGWDSLGGDLESPLVRVAVSNAETGILGDLDNDGTVTILDLQRLLQIYLGRITPTPGDLARGDSRPKPGLNGKTVGDGVIKANDINWALRRLLGLTKP